MVLGALSQDRDGCNPSSHCPQMHTNLHLSLFPPSSDLQAPLESLELAFCSLVPTDLAFLSQSFHAPALKRLNLSSHDFSQGLLEPLWLLLEETSASLLHLDLMECCMADSHLDALLPTLRHCSCLCFLGVYGNPLSTATLRDLLQKTLELRNLHLVVYPFPVDCCKPEPPLPESAWNFEEAVDEKLLAAVDVEFCRMAQRINPTPTTLNRIF
uniref:Leucine-rich repeat-containing protein 14 n=1 Tax=Zonotrichia albicollis TaxID=44394 RepID=A0A8D2M5R6_ZONAL